MFHAAMNLAKPEDVIVIEAGGSIRDVDAMSKMNDFAVYARGITPDGTYKNGPGEVNTPVVCGGRVVYPGDIVLGDEDGVIFIRPEEAPALLDKVKKIHENELKILDIMKKDGTCIRPWADKKLEACEVEYVEYVEYI